MNIRYAFVLGMILAAQPQSLVFAQQCDEGTISALALDAAIALTPTQAVEAAIETAPATAPKARPATAPVAAGKGAGASAGVERPFWIALAIEQGYATENDEGAVTISLSPFDWMMRDEPTGYFDNSAHFHSTLGARRLTGSLTFGGAGMALDTNNDGTPEPPAPVKSLTDSTLLELQYVLVGSTDRRDITIDPSAKEMQDAIASATQLFAELQAVQGQVGDEAETRASSVADKSADSAECKTQIAGMAATYRALPDWSNKAPSIIQRLAQHDKALLALAGKIDKQLVLSLALAALDRKDYLGADRVGISLRGRWGVLNGGGGSTNEFDLNVGQEDSLVTGQDDIKSATLSYKHVRPASMWLGNKLQGSTWALSITGEKNWDAPVTAKTSKAVLGISLNVPFNDAISIPFSLTWANRDELLGDNDEVVGHVGLSFSFDAFKPKTAP